MKRTPGKRQLALASAGGSSLRLAERAPRAPELATLAGIDAERRAFVRLAGAVRPIRARVASSLALAELQRAAAAHGEVLVMFSAGEPVIAALILAQLPEPQPLAAGMSCALDGQERTLTLSAHEQIVLRCGRASITLQRDGRVVVKGTRVETDAEGVNRIKGASVRIN